MQPSQDDVSAAKRLSALLERRAPDGSLAWTDDQLEEALAVLFLSSAHALPDLTLSPEAEQLVGRYASRFGVTGASTEDEAMTAFERALAGSSSPLLGELRRFFLEESARGGEGASARAFGAFLGSPERKGPLQQEGPRPAGTVAAGPMARFLMPPADKKVP